MKITYFLRDNGGCGWYRMMQPLETARRYKAFSTSRIEKGDRESYIGEKLAEADVVVIPRLFDDKFFKVISALKELKKKIVVDWDDNIFCVRPLSPHYSDFGTEPYSHVVGQDKLDVWADGVNINLTKNRENLERAKKALSEVDMVTTTTDLLADVFREFNPNVKVLPNCIDLGIWKKLPLRPHSGIRMGWSGGYSHFEDWAIMAQILPQFMERNPNVTLVLLGQKFEGTLKGIDPARIEYQGWCPTPAYPYVSAIMDLDFAVIPLADNLFNRCKSPLKWLEMAALEVPAVTSHIQPYSEMMDLVNDNGIFIENNDPQAWFDGMDAMVRNTTLRKSMGKAAYKTVEQFFDIDKKWPLWRDAYESLVEKPLEVI